MRRVVRNGLTILAAAISVPLVGAMPSASAMPAATAATAAHGPDELFFYAASGLAPDTATSVSVDGVGTDYHRPLATRTSSSLGGVGSVTGERSPADLTPGTYAVTFTQADPHGGTPVSVAAAFTIEPPSLELITSDPPPGGTYQFWLRGLGAGTAVHRTDTIDGVRVARSQYEGTNFLQETVSIPDSIAPGRHTLTVTQDTEPAVTVSDVFYVMHPMIEPLTSLDAPQHGTFLLRGYGFGVGEPVDVAVTDSAGHRVDVPRQTGPSFVTAVELPDVAAGPATVTATGARVGVTATWQFTVDAAQLVAPQALPAGSELDSPRGYARLVMQTDGNLVAYVMGVARWSSRTSGHPGAYLAAQGDGNLVVYAAGRPLWASKTAHQPAPVRVVVQDDGNVVLYTPAGRAAWSTGTARAAGVLLPGQTLPVGGRLTGGGTVALVMQSDGNAVLFGRSGTSTWTSRTTGFPGGQLTVRSDGEVVVDDPSRRDSGDAPSYSNRVYSPGARLVAQADGNLVEYTASGRAVWSTGTAGR